MDKFYVKPKKNLVSTNPSSSRTSAARTSSEGSQFSGRKSGVGNIYTKLRHKIEDNLTPKISGKLYKTGKHSKSMTALSSIGSSTGKYTLRHGKITEKQSQPSSSPPNPYAECYSLSPVSNYFAQSSSVYMDSDDDYDDDEEDEAQLSLNLAKTSLEDEIFQELEKVAHDENKLNAVLKSFDKIIFDYNSPLIQAKSNESGKNQTESKENDTNDRIDNEKQQQHHQDLYLPHTNITPQREEAHDKTATIATKKNDNANSIKSQEQTDCRHHHHHRQQHVDQSANTVNKLEKSSSSLSLTRRKCYQSPDSPCLRQMRHAFAKQEKSKSVWELSNPTKIPIFKALPLKTRSKSFCYPNFNNENKIKTLIQTPFERSFSSFDCQEVAVLESAKISETSFMRRKPVENVTKKRDFTTPTSSENKTGTGNKKPELKNKSTFTNRNSQTKSSSSKSKRTTCNLSLTAAHVLPPLPRRSKTSDELLDKCLEKGQQILRKVESLSTQRSKGPPAYNNKLVVRTKSATSKISKDNLTLRRKQVLLHKLNYANEEKVLSPTLESCKIIPPVLGETSDKHAELLVQVTNATRQKQIAKDGQAAQNVSPLGALRSLPSTDIQSDSDDSGHVSNETMEITINHTPSSSSSSSSHSSSAMSLCESPTSLSTACATIDNGSDVTKSLKLSELLQKFERNAHEQRRTTTTSTDVPCLAESQHPRVCTTYRVAEVESIKLIRTHVEIYPNYTKEILFRSGILSELEAKRDELLSDRIIQLQAYCRGYLARRAMAQRRVQEIAVRCIQRNVKAFLAVRDWPWWRLLVRVTPLLNVHRTEEQLKAANEELLSLRAKLDRVENDRNELKTENQKLEAKRIARDSYRIGSPMSPLQNELVVSQDCDGCTQMATSEMLQTGSRPNMPQPLSVTDTTKTYNNNTIHNNDTHNHENYTPTLTFLDRVRLAMNSSKPPIPKNVATISGGVSGSSRQPPHKQSNFNYPSSLPLSKDGSNSSLSSNATNTSSITSPPSTPSPRPPVPPQDPNRLRKQMKLIPKQRERSPGLTVTNGNAFSSRSFNYDSDDGLRSSSSSSNRTSCNRYSNNAETVVDSPIGYSATVPVEVKLKLPLPKLDATTAPCPLSLTNGSNHRTSAERLRLVTRSPSPAFSLRSTSSRGSSVSSSASTTSRSAFNRLQTPPRRVFPQTYTQADQLDAYEMRNLEQSPVVFDANLSFVLGCRKQPVHQSFRPSPSFEDPRTTSAYLSEKIQNFLKRTDHVQEEWSAMGRRSRNRSTVSANNSGRNTPTNSLYDDYDTVSLIERQRERNSMERSTSVGRTKSSQNILTKAFQLSKTLPRTPISRSNSLARETFETDDDDDDRTIKEEDDNDLDELSEMTVDLVEERSTANMATERLEAETGERLRLERELSEKEIKVKNLQESTEKLEMELICAKSDLNGISEDEDLENEEAGSTGGVYNKLKYERVAKELEFTKRRLQTQHEHDLEQLIGLKKQLEKKLSDAYEEVEEQRQVVSQWKRKAQKMTNEMNDLRMLLEEQNARNNLLEKKQRKFDAECQALQDTTRQERQSKERLSREKDVLIAEKFTLEQSLADTRLELDLKEEKLASLQRELEEMTFGGGTEEEIAQLRRSKNELDRRVKEQEEELDEMAGQVQLLEQAKLRLEMTLETMRKEARREAQQRDEELEEARGSAYKKIKALECQLETEHEERTLLLREKHELERRLSSMEDQDRVDRQAEEVTNQKLRRDLRKYKALLKDAHAQLERLKADTPGKTLIRQLRNQLEDAESARTLAMKARQTAEADLAEVQAMYEESNRARNEAEDRANAAQRDRTELQAQIEENEEELAELMKKYSASVKQLNNEQIAASEYEFKLSELEAERNNLKEQVADLQHRLDNFETLADPSAAIMSKRLELRTKELETRLELEQATRARLEVQVNRHKEALERLQNEVSQTKVRELLAQETLKKSQKSLRELREEFHAVSGKEQESVTKRKDLEKKVEQVESEASALKNDLRLALQRIADLQQAMEEGDDDLTDSDDSQSSDGSLSDLEDRLKPIQARKHNGGTVSTTTTLVREKPDNSPRIILTTPSSPDIHKLAKKAKKLTHDDPKHSLFLTVKTDTFINGDVS